MLFQEKKFSLIFWLITFVSISRDILFLFKMTKFLLIDISSSLQKYNSQSYIILIIDKDSIYLIISVTFCNFFDVLCLKTYAGR